MDGDATESGIREQLHERGSVEGDVGGQKMARSRRAVKEEQRGQKMATEEEGGSLW